MIKIRLFVILLWLASLVACGGGNGLVSSGQSGVAVQSIVLSPTNPSITLTVPPAQPATQTFVAIATPNIGNPYDITRQVKWSTTDSTVATVDKNGVATAGGSGRTYVGFSYIDPGSGKTFAQNTILSVVPQLTGITISPSGAQIAAGTSQQFTATGSYNDGSSADITSQVAWNSSQPAATISGSPGTQGLATGVLAGSTNITARLAGVNSNSSSLTITSATLLSLTVTPSGPTVPLATRKQLTATGTFSDGTSQDLSRDVSWSTLQNPSGVARVSATGCVTGLGLGSETITAQSPSGPAASTSVDVDESSVGAINVLPVNMVQWQGLQTLQAVLANGTKWQMRALATFKDGSSLDVTNVDGIAWSSSNTAVATVDAPTGLATTQGAGNVSIVAALGSKQGNTSFKVLNAPLWSLSVAPNGALLPLGGIQNVVATATFVAPDDLTLFQQDVSNAAAWSVDANATLSYVNSLQEVATGTSSGVANVSATFTVPGGSPMQASSPLTVTTGELSAINLAPGSAVVPIDGSRQFIATGIFSDGTQQNLSLLANWAASDQSVSTVSDFGFMAASGPGQTDINASMMDPVSGNTITGSGPVLVNPAALARIDICAGTVQNPLVYCPPLDPQQPPPNPTLGNQTQFGLVAIGTFTDGSRQDLTDSVHWMSANPQVATVSDDQSVPGITTGVARRGVLTGNQNGGTAIIQASSGSIAGSATVQVDPSLLQSLVVTPSSAVTTIGQTTQLKVSGTFSDSLVQDVTSTAQWMSLNPDVAIIMPGGLAYTTGTGGAGILQAPSGLVVSHGSVYATMLNPSATGVFSWPIGTVFMMQGVTVSSGDVSMLNNTPFQVVNEYDPSDPQHLQPCKAGLNCTIVFAAPAAGPVDGNYTVTGGYGVQSALLVATVNVYQNTVLTALSGAAALQVQYAAGQSRNASGQCQ